MLVTLHFGRRIGLITPLLVMKCGMQLVAIKFLNSSGSKTTPLSSGGGQSVNQFDWEMGDILNDGLCNAVAF